jgi:hypothetical protein
MSRPAPRPRWDIGDVLGRTDLAVLLDELTQPATYGPRGRRWHCPVPGHDDHHASVTMHTDHRGHERWRCWSGDDTHRGDAIDLIVATQGRSRRDAIEWLAERAGLHPDQPPPPVRRTRPPAPPWVPLHPAIQEYAATCEHILWTSTGAPIYRWLHDRGFDDETLHANRVGADPGRRILTRIRGLPYGASPAVVFPALDPTGALQYLQARYLEPGDGPKYDNPAGRLGSNPRLAWTRYLDDNHRRSAPLVVCEGIPDALTAAQAGFPAVAILGSQAPNHRAATQLATHARQHDRALVAIIDADPAGRSWGARLGELLAEHATALTVVEPPDGLDLNAWANIGTDWTATLSSAVETLHAKAVTRDDGPLEVPAI